MNTQHIRSFLQDLKPGDAARFNPPGRQPHNRAFYLRVNGVAYQLFGPGRYRMRAERGEVCVVRLGVAA